MAIKIRYTPNKGQFFQLKNFWRLNQQKKIKSFNATFALLLLCVLAMLFVATCSFV